MTEEKLVDGVFRFIHNLPHDFIEKAWRNQPWISKHLRMKFDGYCEKDGYASANAVLKFVNGLDNENAEIFYEYIINWVKQKTRS